MRSTHVAALAFAALLAVGSAASAHEGHEHKVMGTVAAADATHVEVRGTDGKTESIQLGPSTKFKKGGQPAAATDVTPAAKIVVKYTEARDTKTATEVDLAGAPAPKPSVPAPAATSPAAPRQE